MLIKILLIDVIDCNNYVSLSLNIYSFHKFTFMSAGGSTVLFKLYNDYH